MSKDNPRTSATVKSFDRYLAEVFVGLATSDALRPGTTPKPHSTAFKALTLYTGYLYALDLVGVDVSEARESIAGALTALNVTFETHGEIKKREAAEQRAQLEQRERIEAAKAKQAAEIQSRAMGVPSSALLDALDKQRKAQEALEAAPV